MWHELRTGGKITCVSSLVIYDHREPKKKVLPTQSASCQHFLARGVEQRNQEFWKMKRIMQSMGHATNRENAREALNGDVKACM
jgi:hypothetical protein